MNPTPNICTFCGSALTPGKSVCDQCGAPIEGSPGLAKPLVPPPQAGFGTSSEISPPEAGVRTQPEAAPSPPASYPAASPLPATSQSAMPSSSRRIGLWVLLALLAVILICLCVGIIGTLSFI